MRQIAFAFMSLLMMLSVGCIQSVQPFYKDEQVIAPGEFVGTWSDPKGENGIFVVAANADGKSCVVEFKDDDKTHRFDVNFATVGEKTIADFVPQLTEDEKAADPPKQAHHGFVIVEIKDHDTLLVSAMDYNWFKKLMETDPNTLKHEKVDTEYLLTTTTDELQAFLIKHFATAGAYGEAAEFKRAGATTKSSQ